MRLLILHEAFHYLVEAAGPDSLVEVRHPDFCVVALAVRVAVHAGLLIQMAHFRLRASLMHNLRELQLQLVRKMPIVCDLLLVFLRVKVRHVDLVDLLEILLV